MAYAFAPRSLNGPTPELILRSVQPFQAVNEFGEVAPPLSLSFLPRTTLALNKDTGLSGRGLQAHRSRSQGATTSHSAIFARIFSRGIAMGRSGVTGMACLPSFSRDWHARTMCCRRGAGLLVARHSMRGWTCSPDPASCRCRTLAQATRQEDL